MPSFAYIATEYRNTVQIIRGSVKIQLRIVLLSAAFLLTTILVVLKTADDAALEYKYLTEKTRVNHVKEYLELDVLGSATNGVYSVKNFVQNTDSCFVVKDKFENVSREVIEVYPSIHQVTFDVSGILGFNRSFVYPPLNLSWLYNFDNLNATWAERTKTQIKDRLGIYFIGPYMLPDGFLGLFAKYPLWKQASSYSVDLGCNSQPTDCEDACWDGPNQMKYFGTAGTLHNFDDFFPVYEAVDNLQFRLRIANLDPDDYNYKFSGSLLYSSSSKDPIDPIVTQISAYNIHWVLETWNSNGWEPDWLDSMLYVAVFSSLALTIILTRLMVLHERHSLLIHSMLPEKVVNHLELGGGTYAESFETVTVLFADIVQYTVVCSALSPLQVVQLLDDLYSRFDKLVLARGVYKGKY
jgi:hypothetical protein